MTDHLEEAAEQALAFARELSTPLAEDEDDNDVIIRRIRVAAHLTYLAGLIRGGAVRPQPSVEQVWEQMKARARAEKAMNERETRLQAERERDELMSAAARVVMDPGVPHQASVVDLAELLQKLGPWREPDKSKREA